MTALRFSRSDFAVRAKAAILVANRRFRWLGRRPGEAVNPERRRSFLVRALLIAMAGAIAAAYANDAGNTPAKPPPASTLIFPNEQLMTIGPLPDLVQGSPSASITIIEYASTTCSHCAAFHETAWPELKAKYIDSGRAKFILREFPLDPIATASFMLARCAGPEQRNAVVDQLLYRQKKWAFVDKPLEALLLLVEEIGISQTDAEACLKNEDLYQRVRQSRERAAAAFDIDSTPTFFVDGHKLKGELTISDFDRIVDPPSK
jgi:protein-disulfide isomerase